MRVMFLLAMAACSTACSAHRSEGPAGPAWPRSAARDADGGESLAPRAAARAIAAIVEEDRPAERAAADKPAAAAPAVATAALAAAAGAPAQDEPLPAEEIVIEVDD